MPSTARIYRDGKIIRETVLSAADAEKFVTLASAVRDCQLVMCSRPESSTDGHALKGVASDAGVPYSERHPDDIYAVLPRLAELLGKHARAVYSHLDEAVNGEVIRNTDGAPAYGLKLAHKNTPVPAPFHPAATLDAATLGMIPLDGLRFDYCELVDAAPAGSGVPQCRAYVRWRA